MNIVAISTASSTLSGFDPRPWLVFPLPPALPPTTSLTLLAQSTAVIPFLMASCYSCQYKNQLKGCEKMGLTSER